MIFLVGDEQVRGGYLPFIFLEVYYPMLLTFTSIGIALYLLLESAHTEGVALWTHIGGFLLGVLAGLYCRFNFKVQSTYQSN